MAITSPLDLPNLLLWMDGSDISTLYQDDAKTTPVTADGQPIGYWADKSGNGHDFKQAATINKFEYGAAVTDNGNSALLARLDGIHYPTALYNDEYTPWQGLHDGSSFSIIVYYWSAPVVDTECRILSNSTGQSNGMIQFGPSSVTDDAIIGITTSPPGGAGAINAGDFTFGEENALQFDYYYSGGDHTIDLYNWHTLSATNSITDDPMSTGVSNSRMFIGNQDTNGDGIMTEGLSGGIAQLIICETLLSPTEKQDVSDWLYEKYVEPLAPSLPPPAGKILVDTLNTYNGIHEGREYWLKGSLICGDDKPYVPPPAIPPEFLPPDIPNLVLWLDGSDATTLYEDSAKTTPVTADSDVVGCWEDKSGSGNDVTQTVLANKPIYKTNVQNSLSVVRGNEAVWLENAILANWKFLTDGSAVSVIVVYNALIPVGYHQYLLGNFEGSPGASIAVVTVPNTDTCQVGYFNDTWHVVEDAYAGQDDYPNGTWNIVQYDYEYNRVGDDLELFNNGISVITHESSGIPSTNNPSAPFQVFAGGADASLGFGGDIAEIIIYDGMISEADRISLSASLSTKWL